MTEQSPPDSPAPEKPLGGVALDAHANLRTIRDVIRFAVTRFNEGQVAFGQGHLDAFDEAVHLVIRALALPLDRTDFFLDAYLTIGEMHWLLQLIDRRVRKRVPTAYLLGEAWLQGLRFHVDKRCIIPRSFVGELLQDGLSPWISDPDDVTRVLDLCTGSGCLAVLAALTYPQATVDAVDLSTDALAVAQRNVEDYQLKQRIRLLNSNLFEALQGQRYDIILCNPPYVTDEAMAQLPEEFRQEPELALAGGSDGLDLVRVIVSQARQHLLPGGILVLELGDAREAMERRFPDMPLTWLTTSAGDDMVFLVQRDDLPR